MFVTFNKIYIFVITLFIPCITTQETTVRTVFVETTTEYVTVITDIPEEDVEEALNHDYGRYSTQSFHYDNNQYKKFHAAPFERCYDDLIKCHMDIVVPHPVCVFNNPKDLDEGYRTFESYCDVYFDNCLRKMRFWRTLNYGKCHLDYHKIEIHSIIKTRRELAKNFREVYKNLLSNQ